MTTDQPDLPRWDEAVARARVWTPHEVGVAPGSGCPVCAHDRGELGRLSPFDGLPHAVIHPLVFGLDSEIRAEVDSRMEAEEERLWIRPGGTATFDDDLARARSQADAAAVERAAIRVWSARLHLEHLRRDFIDPATAAFLAQHRIPVEVPWQWLM